MDEVTARALVHEGLEEYVWAIDTHDPQQFVDCFEVGGLYESPFGVATGHNEIRAAITMWHETGITAGKRHFSGPAHIRVDGDTAHAQSSYFIVEAAQKPGIVASGSYDDLWRRQSDGSWKLARRTQVIDPSWQPAG